MLKCVNNFDEEIEDTDIQSLEKIEMLKELLGEGYISKQEFDEKKKKIFDEI